MSSTVLLAPSPNLLQGPSKTYLPFIVGNSFESVESGFLGGSLDRNGPLLASSEESAGLLSMSEYGKAPYHNSKDYETSQPLQDPMYVAYTQPGLVQPHMQSHTIPYTTRQEQMPYAASALYQPRSSQEQDESTYGASQPRPIPQITTWRPQQGSPGTRVYIYLLSGFEIDPSWTFQIKFASRPCQSTLTKLEPQGNVNQYLLSTEAPPFSTTGWPSTRVPIRIDVQDGSGNEVTLVDVGGFAYIDGVQPSPRLSPELPRKRKMSSTSREASNLPTKRTSSQQANNDAYDGTAYHYVQHSTQSYLDQQATNSMVDTSGGSSLSNYQRTPSRTAHSQAESQDSPGRMSRHLPQNSLSAISQLRGPSPQTPSWAATNIPAKSPNMSNTPHSRIAAMASPSIMANPPLIRTSTLQQSPSPVVTPSGSSANGGGFNPYAIYPSKAVLKINGNLDAMTTGWNGDEYEAKRRLVQFWRTQSGSTINTDFKPVAPEDRQPNSICISCILWESKDEYYVTSVDTIFLLESLVAVRFTVEEKNRIRRNLEGFRPMTVSKGRAESEDFFKLIMSFPNPKPRNIEKDVKVFPWKILSHALKKIIGKYSASYSSTAGALPPSVSSGYRTSQAHDLGGDFIAASHSQEPAISAAYSSGLTASMISPITTHDRIANPYTTASPSMMHLAHAPTTYPAYHFATQPALGQSSGALPMVAQQPPHQQQSSQQQQQQQQQQRPPSWDFGAFMDAPTSAPAGHGLYGLENNANSGNYQMTHASSGS